jgi:tetratricopeptide (TPR) repeat protein
VLAGAALIEAALIEAALPEPAAQARDQRQQVTYRVHPGVAAAIIAAAGPEVQEATDAELGPFWTVLASQVREQEGGEAGGWVVKAGLAAVPYLLRRGDWDTAAGLLENVLLRDGSPGTVQAALPTLRRIATATGTPETSTVLARTLRDVDPAEAERLLRAALEAAAGAGDYRTAAGTTGELVTLLMARGRLAEALEATEQLAGYTQRAGLGPWTQLGNQGRRLRVLSLMGEHAGVLAEVDRLRAAMAALPARPAANDPIAAWNVRETILDTGHASAMGTGNWQRCLELNAETVASKRQRDAGVHEVTRTRYNDAAPLIELGRLDEAGRLLAECQQVFEDHADMASLAAVLGTRAALEAELGHREAAADLTRAALRLRYVQLDPQGIANGHHNLANRLESLGRDWAAGQRAHRLAAALVNRLAGIAHELGRTMRLLSAELDEGGDQEPGLPATVAQVVATAELTEGVRLGALLAALQPDPAAVEAALAEIVAEALRPATLPPADSDSGIAAHLREWEPVIAVIAAICQAGQDAPAELLQFLDMQAKAPDWTPLVFVLRRILAGQRGDPLLAGLDPVDTAIVRETLARLGQQA